MDMLTSKKQQYQGCDFERYNLIKGPKTKNKLFSIKNNPSA